LLTPQDYSKALNESFSKSQGFILKDLFAIPDYDSYFNGCPDIKFGCYAKKEKTQLQFTLSPKLLKSGLLNVLVFNLKAGTVENRTLICPFLVFSK
jgi:hypothetical protein